MSTFGLGGLIGALGLLAVSPTLVRRRISSWFAAGFGLTLVTAALAPWFWSLVALLVVAGISVSVTNTSTNTIVQTTASSALRGQVVSLYILAIRGSIALGSLATGLSVSLLGVRQALLINGALAILVQALIGRHWRGEPAGRNIGSCYRHIVTSRVSTGAPQQRRSKRQIVCEASSPTPSPGGDAHW